MGTEEALFRATRSHLLWGCREAEGQLPSGDSESPLTHVGGLAILGFSRWCQLTGNPPDPGFLLPNTSSEGHQLSWGRVENDQSERVPWFGVRFLLVF